MSKSRLSVVTYQCARCRVQKPAIEFQPAAEAGILIRSDSCSTCCQKIAVIRRDLVRHGRNGGRQ